MDRRYFNKLNIILLRYNINNNKNVMINYRDRFMHTIKSNHTISI